MHKIGAVTIGQSPRVDITADILPLLSSDIELVEAGAMDNYTLEEIEKLFAPENDDIVLVSRMRDGGQCVLAERKILTAVTDTINRLADEGCEMVVLLCTGRFPKISCKVPLITPYSLLHGVVGGIFDKGSTIAVVAPHPQQTENAAQYWVEDGYNAVSASVSPYIGGDMIGIIKELELSKPQAILLDCLGYSMEMKKEVKKIYDGPVLLPRTLIAQTLNEMFGE